MATTTDSYILKLEVEGQKAFEKITQATKDRSEAEREKQELIKQGFKTDSQQVKAIEEQIKMYERLEKTINKVHQEALEYREHLSSSIEKRNSKAQEILLQTANKTDDSMDAKTRRQQLALAEELLRRNKEELTQQQKIDEEFKKEATSIAALKEKVKDLRSQYELLSKEQRVGDEGKKITDEIKSINRQLDTANRVFAGATEVSKADSLRQKLVQAKLEVRRLEQEYQKLTEAQKKSGKGQFLAQKIQLAKNEVIKANNELNKTNEKISKINKTLNKTVDKSKLFANVFKKVGLQMVAGYLGFAQATVAIGNAIKSSIQTAIDFNKELSKLSAILGVTPSQIKELSTQARRLGEGTRFTATQVVKLQTELAKLGFNKGEILGMSDSVLKFAQAVGTDLPDAAKTTGAVMRVFDYSAHETEQVLNMLAKATTSSALTFDYISTALPIAGQAAKQSGFQMQDLIAILGTLANSGMSASMAATATRNIFLKMADANGALVKTLGKQPKTLKELTDGMAELNRRGVNLNDILQMTGVRATVAFASLLDGSDSVEELKSKIEDSNGAIEQMRQTIDNNLEGAIKRLTSAWEEFNIALQGSQGTMQNIVDTLAGDINKFTRKSVEDGEQSIEREAEVLRSEMSRPNDEYWRKEFQAKSYIYQQAYNSALQDGLKEQEAQNIALEQLTAAINRDKKLFTDEISRYRLTLNDLYDTDTGKREKNESNAYLSGLRQSMNRRTKNVFDKKTFGDFWNLFGNMGADYDVINDIIGTRNSISVNMAKLNVADLLLNAIKKQFKIDIDRPGIGVDNKKGHFVDMYPDFLDALMKDRDLYRKSRIETQQTREEDIELDKLDFLDKEEKILERLRAKLKSALDMNEGETMEVDGKIMTREQSISYGRQAIETHEALKEMYKETFYPKLIEENAIKENAIRLKETDKFLKLRLAGVQKESKEEFELRKLQIDNEEALELNQANLDFAQKRTLTQAQYEEIEKVRNDALKKGFSKEKADRKAQDKELELLESNHQQQLTLINEKYRKQRIQLRFEEKTSNYNQGVFERNANREIGRTKAAQDYINKQIERDNKAAYLDGLESRNKTLVDPKWTEEELNSRILNAKEEVMKAQQEVRAAYIQMWTEVENNDAAMELNEYKRLQKSLEAKKQELQAFIDFTTQYGEIDNESKQERLRQQEIYDHEVQKAEKALADYRFNLAISTASSIAGTFDTISNAISESSEENERNVKRSKILGLAAVYIQQAVAIAQAIRAASESSITVWDLMANIATAVTTVVASTAKAISSIKQAKFAKGVVDLQGPGTGTSDSIPARLSAGESVMTAKATKLFKPLLLAMNEIATQPNVTLPTSYVGYNPVQAHVTNEQLADSFKESVKEIHPVLSIVDYNAASNKYNQTLILDNI